MPVFWTRLGMCVKPVLKMRSVIDGLLKIYSLLAVGTNGDDTN